MNNWKLNSSLLFLWMFSLNSLQAQIIDSTISSPNILPKVILNNLSLPKSIIPFQPEDYLVSFLNSQFPYYDLFLSRAFVNDSLSLSSEYRSGFNSFSNYMNLNSNNLQLDTGKSISRLSLLLGTKREQLLFLDHKQRIGKNLIATLSYNSIVSEGFLYHQFGKTKAFETSINYNYKMYSLLVNYNFHKVEAEENGGIADGQSSNGLSKSDFGLLKLNLVDGITKFKSHFGGLRQSLKLFDNNPKQVVDSINSSALFIGFNSSYKVFGHSYEGTNDSSFYSHFYINADSTRDSSSYIEFENSLFLNHVFLSSSHLFSTSFFVGLLRNDIKEKNLNQESNLFYLTPFVTAKINWYSFHIESDFQFVKIGSYKKNDYSYNINLSKSFNTNIVNSIEGGFHISSIRPETVSQHYYSNHFAWTNSFLNEKISSLKFNVEMLNHHIFFYGSFSKYENKVYYNLEALPEQYNRNVNLVRSGIILSTRINKFNFYTNLLYERSDKSIVRVPEITIYGRIAYKDYFFKKALLAEFGLSGVYRAAYKANAYMPADGQYYLQDEKTVGGIPTLHLFANLDIGTAVIFLKIENISHNLFSGENELIPNYPVPPRTFKLGIRWNLRN